MTSKIMNRPPGTRGGSNSKIKLALAALVLGLFIPFVAKATLVTEDMAYTTGNEIGIAGLAGGSGWGATAWAAGSGRSVVRSNQVAYASGGYAITQVPFGTTNSGVFSGEYSLYRGATRVAGTPLTNVVWFSALMLVTNGDQGYVGFNSTWSSDAYHASTAYTVGISNGVAVVGYGGTGSYTWAEFTSIASDLSFTNTHLILGRITFLYSGNNSELKAWVDPADLTQLGAAQFTQATKNIGTNLFNVCVGGANYNGVQGTPSGLVTALRFSDGNGDSAQAYTDVTGTTNLAAAPPTVAISPAVPVVGNGGNITLTAVTTANNYQWSFNGSPIIGATSATLPLTGVTFASRGFYSVTVTNTVGSGASTAILEVTNCNLSLLWKGGATYGGDSSTWDVATTNWTLLSSPSTTAAFGSGDTVIFDDSSTVKSVLLAGAMKPGAILFSNSATYSFGNGSIAGSGTMELDGSGEVDLYLPCTYTGNTVINGTTALVRAWPQFQSNVQFNGTNHLCQFALQSASGTVSANFSGTNTDSHVTGSVFLGGFTATLSGNLSHAGDVRVNAGTMILTGSNSCLGGTMVGNTQNPGPNPRLKVGSATAIPFGANIGPVIVNANPTQTRTGVSQSGTLDLNGYSISINGLRGGSGNDVYGFNGVITNSGVGIATLTLGNNDANDDYEGDIVSNIALVKVGGGTQILGSANLSYTGTTVVSNGTLNINGTLNSSPSVDVWGGNLGGYYGNIYTPVTIHAGGTLAPGTAGAIGTLTVNSNVTLSGTFMPRLDKDNGLQNDQLIVAGPSSTLMLGGALTVQNVSTNSTLAVGDSFTLFTATTITGNFSTVNLPYNYGWDTSQLTNGIITVTVTNVAPPQPTLSPVYLDNTRTNFVIGVGTVFGAQYILLGATNLDSPVVWTPVLTNTGTGGSLTNLVPIVPGDSQQFYRYQVQ